MTNLAKHMRVVEKILKDKLAVDWNKYGPIVIGEEKETKIKKESDPF